MDDKTGRSMLPVMWKALQPKNPNEVYFAGNKKKKNKLKSESKPLDLIVKQLEQKSDFLQQSTWSRDQVKEIFPQLKNQEKLEDACYEEIKVLSLEDFRVHTRRVVKNNTIEEKLWNADEFPSVEISAEVNRKDSRAKPELTVDVPKPFSSHLKKLSKTRESDGLTACDNDKVVMSTSTQTDHLLFAESNPNANVRYLCTNLPPDVKKLFLDHLFEKDELRRLLVHLIKLFCSSGGNRQEASSVPLRSLLSLSEKEFILSQIF